MDHMVFIVDDDPGVREALVDLLASQELHAVSFGSAAEYAGFPASDVPACLVLDLKMPEINGLDFQRQIADRAHPPIIFISGEGDIPSAVSALKAGALNFLTKPLAEDHLVEAVRSAIAQDRVARQERAELDRLQRRASRLTPRERQVLPLVVSGLLNKQAAAELGISEVTLQIHRSKIMQKMEANSLADLVRMAARLKIQLPPVAQPAD
jgi:FixJ family two-component response regulator